MSLASALCFVLAVANVAGAAESERFVPRQASASSFNALSAPEGTASAPPPGSSIQTSFSFSLLTTNPTAFPLSFINSAASSAPTIPLSSTPAPGSVPTDLSAAPPIPNPVTIAPSAYPSLDVVPPTDSPEVQEWIQEVANSGVNIPNINQTVLGGCPANLDAVNDPTRCWWTCGGCTRDTDITTCPDKGTWGLTYDDGPSPYTSQLLDYLEDHNLHTTFFVVGSRCISYPATLQAEYIAGHQIAVHTWSHPYLTTLTNEQIIAELGWSRKVIKDILGVTPNMMRPPYGDIDDRVRNISVALGLQPVIWTRISPTQTFDTDDFDIHSGITPVEKVLQNWEFILGNETSLDTGFIVLEHDLFQQTVEVATGYILPDALAHQPAFNIMPVVQCLNKPMSDAYVELNDNTTNPPIVSAAPGSTQSGSSSGSGSNQKSGAATIESTLAPYVLCAIFAAVGAVLL